MNAPAPNPPPPAARLMSGYVRTHRAPTPGGIARRRIMVTATKWLLPVAALALLSSIALWPEFDRASDQARLAMRRIGGSVDGAQMRDPHYRGIDEKNRPYTLTAATARQVDPERVDLVSPKGDVTLQNGTWLMVEAEKGVLIQRRNILDLSENVLLYRDDGTTLRTQSATMDLRNGAATSAVATHAEGPFGVLDATGFTLTDKGAVLQFPGPARLIMNAHQQ